MSAQIMEAAPSVWTAAHQVDARRPRSLQTQLGASDTVCERRAAYVLARTEPTDVHEKRAALLGTYTHAGLLESVRSEYRWQIERSVEDEVIRGHVDAVQLDSATAGRLPQRLRPLLPAPDGGVIVEDIKTKSTFLWDKVLRYGPSAAELRQAYLYAGVLATTGFQDVPGQRYLARLGPLPVAAIRFRFINRDSGAEHPHEVAFEQNRATEARWWVQRVREYDSPEQARRDFQGPGLDAVCDHCPWAKACWGIPAPGRAVQSAIVHDDQDRAQALAEYVAGHELETAGKNAKAFARKKLDGSPAGIYGANQLSWSGGDSKTAPDVQAMVDLFEEAQLVVPMVPDEKAMVRELKNRSVAVPERTLAGKTPISISVKPAKPVRA